MTSRKYTENAIEVIGGDIALLFSYGLPVAARINGIAYRTATYHSVTTSRHINTFLENRDAIEKPQGWFDGFALQVPQ